MGKIAQGILGGFQVRLVTLSVEAGKELTTLELNLQV